MIKYIKWFVYAIVDLLFNIICYITNPIVVLFANELGELPGIFKWWAQWDNCLDIDWMVYEHHVPKFAEYDFNKHYHYIDEWDAEKIIGKHHGFVILLDDNFTIKERLQRYICRLIWMYRNCAYGFSYNVTGVKVDGADIRELKTYAKDGYMFKVSDNAWVLRYNGKSFIKGHHWKIFLGWKMQSVKSNEVSRCMLAFCINPLK